MRIASLAHGRNLCTLMIAMISAAGSSSTADKVSTSTRAQEHDHSLHFGLSLNSGNSESVRLNLGAASAMDLSEALSYRGGIEYNYGESASGDRPSTRDLDNGKFSGNARWTVRSPWFLATDVSALFDRMAEIDRRISVGPAIGIDMVHRAGLHWSIEAGPALLWERVAGAKDEYVAVRVAEQFDWKPDHRLRLWHRIEWTADASEFLNALLNIEVGIESRIGDRTRLRSVLQDRYDVQPAPGVRHNDVSLVTGLAVEL